MICNVKVQFCICKWDSVNVCDILNCYKMWAIPTGTSSFFFLNKTGNES